jgi:acyl-CoA reductase-like NAD-dependent aldehyde dehydrogenase
MDAARLKAIAAVKDAAKAKDKPWKNLSASEKDALRKAVCKMLGLYGGTD